MPILALSPITGPERREAWSALSFADPKIQMHTTLSYQGNVLLARTAAAVDLTKNVTCLVWGSDASQEGRPRHARRALRASAADALAVGRAHAGLKHLVLIYRCSPQHRRHLRGAARSAARRLHTELERARARYIDVVVIDITDLDDQPMIEQRLSKLAGKTAGIVGYAAIAWEELLEESIHDICSRDVV